MKKKILSLKKIAGCLLVIFMLFTDLSLVATATEGNIELTTDESTNNEETTDENVVSEETVDEEQLDVHDTDSPIALVEIQSYSIKSGTIEAGQDVEILVDLKNVSNTSNAVGVMMTVTNNSGMLFPAFGTDNQLYVGTIAADEIKTICLPMTVNSSFEGDYVDLICRFDYESMETALSNTATMVFPAASGEELLVHSVGFGSKAIVNANSLLSINYSNMSDANINDAVLNIKGNVTDESRQINLGTAYAEKSYMKDYHITFTEVGKQSVAITLTYTNAADDKITKDLGSYSVEVSEETNNGQESQTVSQVIIWAGRLIALFAAAITIMLSVLYIKKR